MKSNIRVLLTVLISTALFLSGCAKAAEPSPSAPSQEKRMVFSTQETSIQEAVRAWRDKSALIIDVRTPEEFGQGHIPGAKLIPLSDLEKRYGEIPKEKPVLIICRSGNRSSQANILLQKYGFTNTRSIQGGMLAWPERVEK